MRDIALTLFIFGGLLYALTRPKIGIYLWTWISYMNIHRLSYGFAYSMPFAQIIALVVFISLFISKEPKKLPINGIVILWLFFIFWMFVTTIFAIFPADAIHGLIKNIKIQLFCFITLMLVNNRQRLEELTWITMFSIGFFGIKGGIFTITTGGSARVWGPPQSEIEENNGLAIALLMVMPFFLYKAKLVKNKWFKRFLYFSALMMFASAIGSYSRGALLAITAVALFSWWKSDQKILGLLIIPIIPAMVLMMPDSYMTRMNTIETYDEDESAMGRIFAWKYAVNLASDRITGGGFGHWSTETFEIWGPEGNDTAHVAHSIYFQVIGDQGWIGFIVFFSILVSTWFYVIRIMKAAKKAGEDYVWMVNFCKSLQISYIAFGVGGAFLSLCYFDLAWNLIGMAIIVGEIAKKEGLFIKNK